MDNSLVPRIVPPADAVPGFKVNKGRANIQGFLLNITIRTNVPPAHPYQKKKANSVTV